jgi:RecA/RadA recombinase
MDKIRKNSTIKESASLNESKLFDKDVVPLPIPALNIALCGDMNGGFYPGLTLWAGPSKHFKSMFSLIMAKAYMDKYPDAVCIFYDCEFGTPMAYFDSLDMDKSRILHTPIMNMEEFKLDAIKQLESFSRGDRVIFVVDSLGNMASLKELDDAIEGKTVQDMSRAKQMKSIFRMITPYLVKLDIPMVAVAHIYMTQEMYSKPILSGGTGLYLSADNIYILGRQQDKEGTDVVGFNFVINVEKSRHVREKSKIPISVKFEGGVSKWSGLLDMAMDAGVVIKPSNGWYSRVDADGVIEDKKWRRDATDCLEFWDPVVKNKNFTDWISRTYKVSSGKLFYNSDEKDVESDS